MRAVEVKFKEVKLSDVICAITDSDVYEESREILIEDDIDGYTIIYGYHCSCYGFEDTKWDGTSYTKEELEKLVNAPYNEKDPFCKLVRLSVFNKAD